MLNEQIAQKEQTVKDKTQNTQRQETLYLPKLRTTAKTKTYNLVLRFNRLYEAEQNSSDFDRKHPNELGTPKQDRGLMVDSADFSNKFKVLLNAQNKTVQTVTIFVYSDSVDNFYKVRDIITTEGFEYVLLPSPDDASWTFGGSGGTRDVQ
jgi:hypothetical protein